jgi:hypothetical protein
MNRLSIQVLALLSVIGGTASHGQTMPLDLPSNSGVPQDTLVSTTVPPVTEAEMAGYYPTASDLFLLGDQDYPRRSFTQEGPDASSQLASDIFMYESGEQDFYARNREMFDPINRVLGVFTPQKAFTAEFSALPLSGIALDGGFPIFTRTFEPRNAHLKLGPLAFDLIWLGAGALWSDFNGVNNFPAGQEDGWISFLEVAVRGNLQITDTIHLSWLANLVYLPGTNEIALSSLNNGFPNVALDLFFQRRVGTWDILLSDRFYARPGLDLFAELAVDGFDRSGRYQFGFYGREGQINTYDTRNVWLTNEISAKATTMIPEADWRFWLNLQHLDFWQSFDFDDHQSRDTLEALLGYEGNSIPFAPSLSYTVSTFDQFESFWHRVQLMFNGRLTENIQASAMGGYLWTSNLDPQQVNYLWSLGLTHQFSQKGSHAINVGQNLFEDPFSPEVQFATYYRYNIDYQLAKKLTAGAYVQYSDGEFIVSTARRGTGDFETYLVGATLQFQPFDFTRITGLLAYEDGEFDNAAPYDRWVYRVMLTQQLASRLTLETLYQFEDFKGVADFNEHLVSMSLRWYF